MSVKFWILIIKSINDYISNCTKANVKNLSPPPPHIRTYKLKFDSKTHLTFTKVMRFS